jgi:hypothetical protein
MRASGRTTMQPAFQIHWNSFLNRAASRRCCPRVRTVALLLHAISIIRTECLDSVDNRPDGCTFSARLALSRIVSRQNNHVVWMVAALFPYLCLEMKSFYLSNTKRRPDVLLRRPNKCNLEQFEASGHRWESGWKVLIVHMEVAWLKSVQTKYHVIRMDARDLNFTVLKSTQNLLESHKWNVDSEYK